MRKPFGKRTLALILTLALLTSMLPLGALAEEAAQGGAQTDALADALNADTTYYEVEFALPDGITEEEAAEITLPDTVMLPA